MQTGTFVRMAKFCPVLDSPPCPINECILPGEPNALLSWANEACNLTTDAQKLWNDSTSKQEEAYSHLAEVDSFDRGPSCSENCQALTSLYSSSLFSETCIGGTVYSSCIPQSEPLVNRTQFCIGLPDPKECPGACTFGNSPRELFTWANGTCAKESFDIEMWRNATMAEEEAWVFEWIPALVPWNWTVQASPQAAMLSTLGIQITDPATSSTPYLSIPPWGPGTCASSTSEKLGVFAAVNIVSALLIPILGRRTVVRKLTFGIGGKLGSSGWPLMGVLSACLHVSSNLVNARIIRSVPGYEDVPFAALALLWCTRPRLSWLAVFLATREAEDGMYFNAAASAITTEAILQVLGAVYFGITANYGRKKRFYYIKHLDPYPRGIDAHIMYAGALLWLITLFFTLVACVACIAGLSTVIANARKMMSEVSGAGANALRSGLLAQRWIPRWIRNRTSRNPARPAIAPRQLTEQEVKEIGSITIATIIFITFLAQWLFWAGFVRTARER
jgi:hypothetical protein